MFSLSEKLAMPIQTHVFADDPGAWPEIKPGLAEPTGRVG